MSEIATPKLVDVRRLPPRERHPTIFQTFRGLADGEAMELVNDHDPKPLFYQFQIEAPGQFLWQYLECGPETWRVRISRQASPQAKDSCCGGCGGA